MEHLHIPQFVGLLVIMLAAAKVLGALTQRSGQPAVLGEAAGLLLGETPQVHETAVLRSTPLSVSIECLPRPVHGFVSNPENLPSNARGL
jgi:Kef-type K+ transport system membrane component KefB